MASARSDLAPAGKRTPLRPTGEMRHMLTLRYCLLAIVLMGAWTSQVRAADSVDLKYDRVTLDNGLTLIVHEDHKAPVVAVSVWYHIGSADELTGKTGFAHLFEHLMFSGSENHKGTFFEPLEKAGATDMNGTTSFDRTNYFETVPTTALDMALWMESDRMGHLLGAIGQSELDADDFPRQPSVPPRHHWFDGRSQCRLTRGCEAVVSCQHRWLGEDLPGRRMALEWTRWARVPSVGRNIA